MTTSRTISHSQYESLRWYEDGHDRWINGGAPRSLVASGLIQAAPHDRAMFHITPAGNSALSAYRDRYGVHV